MSKPEHDIRIGVMAAGGVYNRNATSQRAAAQPAWPVLEQAARDVPIDAARGPVVIADYGASQGRNSLAPMRAAIAVLRRRLGDHWPIAVVHTDLPGNDFSTLFTLIASDPESYAAGASEIYSYAIGRTFYEDLFAPATVWLGWSSFATHWLSRAPIAITDHIHARRPDDPAAVAAYEEQAAADWRRFLACRGRELRPGARLVVAAPTRNDDGTHPLAPVFDQARAVLVELVQSGEISPAEYGRMTTGEWPQTRDELRSPFGEHGSFGGLLLRHFEIVAGPDALWDDFTADRDQGRLAQRRAAFFRAAFVPTLSSALDPGRPGLIAAAFADRLEAGLAARLQAAPALRLTFDVAVLVAEKVGGEV